MTTLRLGSSGADVVVLQTRLTAHGFACSPDGAFGPHTLLEVKAFQSANGLTPDGIVGPMTWALLAPAPSSTLPRTTKLNGMPAIMANDLLVVPTPRRGLSAYANSLNGSFFGYFKMPDGSVQGLPVAICVAGGKVICPTACHSDQGCPESTLYRTKAGVVGVVRAKNVSELPPDLSWAVGGLGLLGLYAPSTEGFRGAFSDVLRTTDHSVIGYKAGLFYLVLCRSMSGPQVNAYAKAVGFEKAIMLDGGHIAGIHGSEAYAHVNTSIMQINLIQGI